ncbi:HAMP domain-containing protein [Polynucleobacter sp. MWH-Loch1C5]|uniref:sensor histidine kinase n=1 Tax=Polynucleobacter sp. MWH-Loch1C5 TaxID=2689108 RepID=UPI001C0AF4A4|nr:ATP-binding protein [Polynucleobacter sp. MWH-Loch1C5]MBU3542483.1 HAMP domain-containing protein [Polynucleobacter sp. MWH-Loch1C5]
MLNTFAKPFFVSLIAILALTLLVLLALASANTQFFDQYFTWLYVANIVIGLIFLFVIITLVFNLWLRWRKGQFGSKLIIKLAAFFALVGVLPGAILYGVSLQFVSRSIESWFDVKVENALEAGLSLGKSTIQITRQDLLQKGTELATEIDAISRRSGEGGLTLLLSRQRQQIDLDELTLLVNAQKVVASSTTGLVSYASQMGVVDKLDQAKLKGSYIEIDEPNRELDKSSYTIKILIPIYYGSSSLGVFNLRSRSEDRFLLLVKNLPVGLSNNALAVQEAYTEYQEKALGRSGLRKMYIGTLTISLFLAMFIAMGLAFYLGRQLAYPLITLLKGTKEVAEGNLSPKPEINTGDELGLLTKQFNLMTSQLREARTSIEQARKFSETVLSNLSAGVCVFDIDFRLVLANSGADRIFSLPLQQAHGKKLSDFPKLVRLEQMVQEAFATHEVISDDDHWQKQLILDDGLAIDPQHEHGITLLARGSKLSTGQYILVFDDISDVVSAQRALAWGEVARRLAHEIKNPLTPIQLSAERLQQKLSDSLEQSQKELLEKSTNTIINQVQAMKTMVDDFRDFAKTPEANLQDMSLNGLIEELLGLYEQVGIQAQLDSRCPMMKGDPTQLRQVIHNLLQNSMDASSDAGRQPEVIVKTEYLPFTATSTNGKGVIRMTVKDSGSGFSAKILARAFEPYVTTKAKGTGLGLAMVKKIVDDHQAKIEIRNIVVNESVTGAEVSILFNRLV